MIALARPLRVEKAWHAVSVTLWEQAQPLGSHYWQRQLETSSLGSCILHILVLDDSVAENLDVS